MRVLPPLHSAPTWNILSVTALQNEQQNLEEVIFEHDSEIVRMSADKSHFEVNTES